MSMAIGVVKPTLRERCDERLNAVLVKEMRAGLRGKTLRFAFPVTLMVAVTITTLVIVNQVTFDPEGIGADIFMPIYGCLATALMLLVPFSAFQSMGGEWDENTFDLLVISDLRPRQIVFGKLVSAAVEAGLYLCAFAPLLVFAFLLRGLDIRDVVVLVLGVYLASLAYTAIALAVSSLTRLRIVRVFLLAIVAGGAIACIGGCMGIASEFVMLGGGFARRVALDEILGVYTILAGAGLLGFTIACERLTHPEENHSTPLRLLVAALAAVAVLSFGYLAWSTHSPRDLDDFAAGMVVVLATAHIFFTTEAEGLSRRVRRMVPKRGWLAFLSIPFQPGGGRGLLLFHLLVAALFVACIVIHNLATLGSGTGLELSFKNMERIAVFATYFSLYLSLGSFMFMKRSGRPVHRVLARVLIPTIVILTIFLPSFIGFLVEDRSWIQLEHPLNPFYVASSAERGDWMARPVIATAALCLVLNYVRVWRGALEILVASAARRTATPMPPAPAALAAEVRE